MRGIPQLSTGLCVIAMMAASCSSSKKTHVAKKQDIWQAQPIVVDGANNDWPSPIPYYDGKAKIGYAVSNDRNNLYITMQTGDPQIITKILRSGMTVSIDPTGKKEQNIAINYPTANNMAPTHAPKDENAPRPDRAQRQQRMLEGARDIVLTGFKDCNGDFSVQQNNNCGIVARMGFDEYNTLIWEAVVPFKSFYKPELVQRDMGKAISICFSIKGLKLPAAGAGGGGGMRGNMRGGMGGNMGGMGGMRGGMGMGGGMHGGGGMRGGGGGGYRGGGANQENREDLTKSTNTWVATGLAYQ